MLIRVCFVCLLLVWVFVFCYEAAASDARVVRVIDGDTLVVSSSEFSGRVRLIGVNAPEISKSECFAQEAKSALYGLVYGRFVSLSTDRGRFDKYGRLLAYVSVGGTDVNVWLARNGFVKYMFVAPNFARMRVIKSAVYSAIRDNKGLWYDC